ncbi:hypothetical protein D9M68_914000 [compost metagenome]
MQHQRLDHRLLPVGQTAGHEVLGVVGEVLVLVVVVAFGGNDADHRQGLRGVARAQHRAGDFIPVDELLAHDQRVLLRGQLVSGGALRFAGDLGQADGRTLAHGLDDHG